MNQTPLEEGRYYHIYNRGNNRENLFFEERNYYFFLLKLKKYLLPISNIYAYCLMPNHFHLVLQIKSIEDLGEGYINNEKKLHQPFSNLFNAYTKAINRAYDRTGSLFQKIFHRNLIESEDYLREAILYTLLNPVHHRFRNDYEGYQYSSLEETMNGEPTFIKRAELFKLFGGVGNFLFCLNEKKLKNNFNLQDIEV